MLISYVKYSANDYGSLTIMKTNLKKNVFKYFSIKFQINCFQNQL